MNLKKDVIPDTELKLHMKRVLSRVRKTGRPILVTQKGYGAFLIVDAEAFQKQQNRLLIL